jgi:hypothetical protein
MTASPRCRWPATGVQRWLWHSRFGDMLIEVVGPDVFVNGQRVQPMKADAAASPPRSSVAISFGSPATESGVARLDLNDILIRHPQAAFLMRIAGDSMRGAGVDDGDLALVDRAHRRRTARWWSPS